MGKLKGDKRFYNTQEVAEAAGLTAGRIRQLLLAGELRGEKVGRDWVISRRVAQKFVEKQRGR